MQNSKVPPITEQDIEKFVSDYLANALPLRKKLIVFEGMQPQDEFMKRSLFGQQDFLIISKCNLPDLPLAILRRLPIYLTRQFAVQVEFDSIWYWALTYDITRSYIGKWELHRSFNAMMASHFANLSVHPYRNMPAIERLNRATLDIVPMPVRELVINTDTILMYMCYPVLEGLTKFALSSLVNLNGEPLACFSVGNKSYNKGDRRINSLATLLRCIEENGGKLLSKSHLSNNLRDFRLEVEKLPSFKSENNGWDAIYNLRNASLHGVTGWQLRSGLITNLICLILWNLIDDNALTQALSVFPKNQHHFSDFGYFYPPEM